MADSKRILIYYIILLLYSVKVFVHSKDNENQPKIYQTNTDIIIESVEDCDINFKVMEGSTLFVNDTDLIEKIKQINELRIINNKISGEFSVEDAKKEFSDLQDIMKTSKLRIRRIRTKQRYQKRNITISDNRVVSLRRQLNQLRIKLNKNKCEENFLNEGPCKNNGICYNTYPNVYCECTDGWTGPTCEEDVDECYEFAGTDLGCQNNAECVNTPGSYSCKCKNGFVGTHCRFRKAVCDATESEELCGNGICVPTNDEVGFTCICNTGWSKHNETKACTVDVDECHAQTNPCHSACINLPGSFKCGPCDAGYTGNGLHCIDINECDSDNGGCSVLPFVKCINTEGSFQCGRCPLGYKGDGRECKQIPSNSCDKENICHPLAKCEYISNSVVCSCPPGMYGHGFGANGCQQDPVAHPCEEHACQNNGTCIVKGQGTTCVCAEGFMGNLCEQNDACNPNPCQYGGTCQLLMNNKQRCVCQFGTTGSKCEILREYCGLNIRQATGELSYPSDNTNYREHEHCGWKIITDKSKVLNVTFELFDLENSMECKKDFLRIFDGPTMTSQLLGSFCGNVLPMGGTILSSQNTLLFWFSSNNQTNGRGIKMSWTSREYVCGGIFELSETDSGVIRSPGYPGKTAINRECQWKLVAPLGYRFVLRFYELNLGVLAHCYGDTLKILDEDKELTRFCSSGVPEPIHSLSNVIAVHLHTDEFEIDSSFQMHYEVVHGTPHCGLTLIESSGFININTEAHMCIFSIKQPKGTQIRLDIIKLELPLTSNCYMQKIQIFDGDIEAGTSLEICSDYKNLEPFTSETNNVFIRYYHDEKLSKDTLQNSHVEIRYERVCDYKLFGPDGEIVSTPNYPLAYISGLTCTYEIYGPEHHIVGLYILDYSIDSVSNEKNYLEVNDLVESSKSTASPYLHVAKRNFIQLTVHVENNTLGRGVKFQYLFYEWACGGVFKNPNGTLSKEVQEGDYCEWIIQAPENKFIQLDFQNNLFVPDCESPISVFDNSTLKNGVLSENFCKRSNWHRIMKTQSNLITIIVNVGKLTTNASTSLEINYSFKDNNESCGGSKISNAGVIKSPLWPKKYPNSKECEWTISVFDGHQMELIVHNFSLSYSENCEEDYLEIYNGRSRNSILIGKYCGTNIPSRIPSMNQFLHLRFSSNSIQNGEGFYITWQETSNRCGGKLTSHVGTILNPREEKDLCEWQIIVAKGSRIQLEYMDLVAESNDSSKMFEVYDGLSTNVRLMPSTCSKPGGNFTTCFDSTSNEMLIRIKNMTYMAFIAFYRTICNVVLDKLQGVIESPNFPGYCPKSVECKWEIRGGKHDQISLAISHLTIDNNSGDNNAIGYLELIDMSNNKFESVQSFYGPSLQIIKSVGNRLLIKFVRNSEDTTLSFRAEYKRIGCGEHFHEFNKQFATPNIPFSLDMDCEWYIEVEAGYKIVLTFTELKIETDILNCTNDGIVVSEYKDSSSKLLTDCLINEEPVTVTSPANRLYIHFYSSEKRSKKYFKASYTTRKMICGGKQRSDAGLISTPSFLSGYHEAVECVWELQVENGFGIELRFTEFNITQTPNCTNNFLEIAKIDDNGNKIVLEHSCGDEAPNIKLVHGNSISITLKVSPPQWGKFSLNYLKQCGGILTAATGYLKSRPGENCEWQIQAVEGAYISIDILELECECEKRNNCTNGLELYADNKLNAVQSICKDYHAHMTLATTSLFLVGNNIKLRAKYSTIQNSCGGKIMSIRGTIASPLYPAAYPANIECVWELQTLGGGFELNLLELDIRQSVDCNEDFLEIRAGVSGRLLGLYCGNEVPENATQLTAYENVWIKFRTISSGLQKGFKLNWNFAHHTELNNLTSGIILSPPLYGITEEEPFTWRIYEDREQIIQLHFIEYINGLQLYDGFDESALPVNINPSPWIFTSSSHVLFLKTDNSNMEDFKLSWNISDRSLIQANSTIKECSKIITLASHAFNVELTSPDYPNKYKPDLDCEWIIKSETISKHVMLKLIDFDIETTHECQYDYLSIYTSADMETWSLLDTFCGSHEKSPNGVSQEFHGTPYLKVQFTSDGNVEHQGFKTLLSTECGSNITNSMGTIEEIINDNCTWHITVRPGRRIRMDVHFTDYTHAMKINCDVYAIINDGVDEHAPLLNPGKICNDTKALESTGHSITLRFLKNPQQHAFFYVDLNFTYQEINDCNEQIKLTNFVNTINISSPNYPNVPNPHTECTWLFAAPPGELLQAQFVDRFDLNVRFCDMEYVELYDGSTSLARQLGKFCAKPNKLVRTTGNLLYVHYVTELEEPRNGFRLNVSLATCGAEYDLDYAEITSKNYPNMQNPLQSHTCDYIVKIPSGYRLMLNISDFNLPYVAGNLAASDRLEIISLNKTEIILNTYFGNVTTIPVQEYEGKQLILRYFGFTRKDTVKYRGFRMSYRLFADSCYRTVQNDEGKLILNNKNVYMPYFGRKCRWTIKVPKGQRVKLKIVDVEMGRLYLARLFPTLYVDRISMWNNIEKSSLITTRNLADFARFQSFSSSDNIMYIEIAYSRRVQKITAEYSSDEDSPCPTDISRTLFGTLYLPNALESLDTYYCKINWQQTAVVETITFNIEEVNILAAKNKSQVAISFSEATYYLFKKSTDTILNIETNLTNQVLPTSVKSGVISLLQTEDVQLKRFRMSYKRQKCGGYYKLENDMQLETPKLAAEAEDTMVDCVWILLEPNSYNIAGNVSFTQSCEVEYVEFRRGVNLQPVVRLCRDSPQLNTTALNNIYNKVHYHVDKFQLRSSYFQLRIEKVLKCDDNYRVYGSKVIAVNSNLYKNNVECSWTFSTSKGFYLSVGFIGRFFIETSENCTKDYLEIQTYDSAYWQTHGRFCGREVPPQIDLGVQTLRLIFHTNEAITGDGFNAMIMANCSLKLNVTDVQQSLQFPSSYKTQKCIYEFYALGNKPILLRIDKKRLNTQICNLLHAYDEDGEDLGTVCTGDEVRALHYVRLVFKGFRSTTVNYMLDDCHSNITEPSTVHSMYSANSQIGNTCKWRIIAPAGHNILIHFNNFKVGLNHYDCDFVFVAIYEGLTENDEHKLAKYCGNMPDAARMFLIDSNEALLKSKTSPYLSKEGFEADISFTPNCNELITLYEDHANVSLIRSLSVNKSEQRLCQYKISAPENYRISIYLKSLHISNSSCKALNCEKCSYIEIFDGLNMDKSMGKYCQNIEVKKYSSYQHAVIRLNAENPGNYTFEVALSLAQSECGPQQIINLDRNRNASLIFPPGDQQKYASNTHCKWTVMSSKSFTITLEKALLEDISQVTGECKDYIELLSSRFYKTVICGNATGHRYPVKYSKSIDIIFHSDQEKEAEGFRMTFKNYEDCNSTYTNLNDIILENDWFETEDLSCFVDIRVPEQYTLSLFNQICFTRDMQITDLISNKTLLTECNESLKLYTNTSVLRVSGLKGSSSPIYYISSDRKLPPGCGGDIRTLRVTIENPPYGNDRNYSTCRWDFHVANPNKIKIVFEVFDMGPASYCYTDYVQLWEVRSDGKEIWTKTYCGEDQPETFISQTNHVALISKKSPNFSGIGWKVFFTDDKKLIYN